MPKAPEDEFRLLAEATVDALRRLPAYLSGDDSPYADFWVEYAAQVQEEHGFIFSEYERLVRAECDRRAESLSPDEVELLWPATEGFSEWTEDDPPGLAEKGEHVADELFRLVQSRAAELELPT